jgi:hypothetical protein
MSIWPMPFSLPAVHETARMLANRRVRASRLAVHRIVSSFMPGGSPALSDDEQSNAAGGCSSLRAGSGGTLELPVPAGLHNG